MTALVGIFVRVVRTLVDAVGDLWPWAAFESLARSVSENLMNGICQGLLFGGVVWFVLRLLTRLNAATRYAVWFGTLLAVVALPAMSGRQELSSLSRVIPSITADEPASPSEACDGSLPTAGGMAATAKPANNSGLGATTSETSTVRRAVIVPSSGEPKRSGAPVKLTGTAWPIAAFGLWLLLAITMIGRVFWSYVCVQGIKERSSPLPHRYQYRLGQWLRRSGVRRTVVLRSSTEVHIPAAIGLWNPVIVIPEHVVDALSDADIDQIGLHELAHIKRYDDWTNLIQQLFRAVFFFHPAVVLICKRLNLEREIACDDWVLSATEAPRPYASCLTRLAELTRFPVKPLPVPGAIFTKKQIIRRIETMLNRKGIVNPRLSRRGAAIGAMALIFAVAAFVFMPPVISVSAAPPEPATPRPPVAPRIEAIPAVPDVPAVPGAPAMERENARREIERELKRAQKELRNTDHRAPEAAMREAEREIQRAMEAARAADDLTPRAQRDLERQLQRAQEELNNVDRSDYEAAMRAAELELQRAMEAGRAAERMAPEARRAYEADWGQLVQPTPPPDGLMGRTYAGLFDSWSTNKNDDGWTVSWSDGNHRVRVETDGEIEFTDDDTGIESLSEDAYFIIEERKRGQTRELEVQPGRDGKPEYFYEVNRKSQEFDAEGRAWLAEVLPSMLRQTGIGIEDRVTRILEKKGVDGVLREISLVEGDYMKRIHFQELATHGPFDAETMQKFFRQIDLEMESNYDKAELLIHFAPYIGAERESRRLYFQAVTGLDSDYDMRRVLDAMIDEGAVDDEIAAEVLEAAEQLESDYERAELLIAMADYGRGRGAARDAYMRAVAGMESDYEKRRALSALAATDADDTAFVASTLEVAESIGSDYERAEMLVDLADEAAANEGLMRVYLRAATGIGSDYEKSRALSALPLDETTSKETLLDVLGAAETIDSDWEKTEFLKKVAPLYMDDDELKEAFADAVDTISSDYEREQMYSMLWKKGRAAKRGTH